jgi:hypothetical protein
LRYREIADSKRSQCNDVLRLHALRKDVGSAPAALEPTYKRIANKKPLPAGERRQGQGGGRP